MVHKAHWLQGFQGGEVVKNLPGSAGDTGSIPGSGSSPRPRGSPEPAPATQAWSPDILIFLIKKLWRSWASLVVQWLRIHLPMQETQVWSLVWEDPTCQGANKPMCHSYWACSLEPGNCNCWSPRTLEPMLCNKRRHYNEKPSCHSLPSRN